MAYVCNIVNLYISQNTWLYLWHKATQCTNFQTLSFGRSHLYFFYNKFGSNILISHHHNINQLFSSKWIVLQLESDISPELFYNIIYIYIYRVNILVVCQWRCSYIRSLPGYKSRIGFQNRNGNYNTSPS